MYLDTGVTLALLKTDDWLASEVDLESIQGRGPLYPDIQEIESVDPREINS